MVEPLRLSQLHAYAVLLSFKAYESDPLRTEVMSPTTSSILRPAFPTSPIAVTAPADPASVLLDRTEVSRRHVFERLRATLQLAGVDGNSFSKSIFRIGLYLATAESAAADL